jgi:hypothetical protein
MAKNKNNDPTLVDKKEFFDSLARGEEAYLKGKTLRLKDGETIHELIERARRKNIIN